MVAGSSCLIFKVQGVPVSKKETNMSFADFKKRSKNSVSELASKMEKMDEKKSYKDDRFWKPELDKSSNGYAVIRFLPGTEEDDTPWAKYFSHGFHLGSW